MDDKKVLIGKGMSSLDDNTKLRDAKNDSVRIKTFGIGLINVQ